MKNSLIVITLIVLTLITGCSMIQKQHSINITLPNFILIPTFQAEPIAFYNGQWNNLPNSQNNYWSNSAKELVVCGTGGLYSYSTKNNVISYIYKADWYPCRSIESITDDVFMVTDSEGIMNFSLSEKKVLSKEKITLEYNVKIPHYTTENELCDVTTNICASLGQDNIVTFQNREDTIHNVTYLVGMKDNKLFYATDNSHGSVLNHRLNVYDLDSKQNYVLLDDFRADYQFMIFFD